MASGDTLAIFAPQAAELSSGIDEFPQFDVRNNHVVLDYDDSIFETAFFKGVLPRNYAGGGVTVYIHYAMTSATSNVVMWYAAFERISDSQQDIDSNGVATARSVTPTVPGTAGHVDIASIAFTDGAQMDSVAVGEGFRLWIQRGADEGSDTATGDAELWAVEIKET